MSPILWLDFAGVAVFAATGALAASRKELDVVGFVFFAAVTGIGGGTVRDLVLGVPVFWVEAPSYVLICAAVGIAVLFVAPLIESRYKLLLWLDALGLAAYGVYGAVKGLEITGSPVVAVVMGMMTGTLGGILRDVIAREPSVLMLPEIYVTATLAGGTVFVAAAGLGLAPPVAALAGFAAALFLRGAAISRGWTLPGYRSRPGRDPRDIP